MSVSYAEHAKKFLKDLYPLKTDVCFVFKESPGDEILKKKLVVVPVNEDLRKPLQISGQYGFCVDFLEHQEEEHIEPILFHILKATSKTYFHIGKGKPFHWWMERFHKCGSRIIRAEQTIHGFAVLATVKIQSDDISAASKVNIEKEEMEHNINENLRCSYQEISPALQQDTEICLLMGGPSLNDFAEEIYQHAKSGVPVITMNGTYNWAIDHKIIPAAQIVVDGREFNKRFVTPHVTTCKYLIASQCHPDVAKSLPKESVWMWHPYGGTFNDLVRAFHKDEDYVWYPIAGGNTVGLRAFPLLITLGYHKFHVYGFDSCISETKHHAYAQPEDDGKTVMTLEYGGRTFLCYPWMFHQCMDFMSMTKYMMGRFCDMEIYGDGLIAHCVKTLSGEYDGSNEMDVLPPSETGTPQWWIQPPHGGQSTADGAVQEWSFS